MSLLNRISGKVLASRKGMCGNRKMPSWKRDRRLALEYMEPRMMMSGSPLGSAASQPKDGPSGNDQSGIHSAPVTGPAAPAFTATAYSASQINLKWTPVPEASGYLVNEWINGAQVRIAALNGGNISTYAVTRLNAGTTYSFDVAATNLDGTTWAKSGYKSATTGVKVDHPTAATTYANVSGTLWGPSNEPSYLDVQQRAAADCWLMASLAEVAARAPQDIKSMFTAAGTTVENGVTVNLYKVRFYENGVAKYVTVDTELPVATQSDETGYYSQTPGGVLWAALAEKAYAQANGKGYVTTFYNNTDSYAALGNDQEGGMAVWALQAITGAPTSMFDTSNNDLAAAWQAGEFVVLATGSTTASSEMAAGHDYALVNYTNFASNPDSASTLARPLPTSNLANYHALSIMPYLVYNPWGTLSTGLTLPLTTTGQPVYGLFVANANFLSANFGVIGQSVSVVVSGEALETGKDMGVEAARDLVLAGWGT